MKSILIPIALALFVGAKPALCTSNQVLRVATYNLENYLDETVGTREAKSETAKAKIRETIKAMAPDVIALQEVGSSSALEELRRSLTNEGLVFQHSELVKGFDTNVHVAILSRFPFAAVRRHTNESYLLGGRRMHVSRGFAEVEVQVAPDYRCTLFAAHLKSKRSIAEGDETEMRFQEARLLREKIDARLAANPNLNIIVLGDFNDTKDSASTRVIVGRGKGRLVDTRPAERNGDGAGSAGAGWDPRTVTWTHFFAKSDSYERIDYILLSPGMAREWVSADSYIPTVANWGLASDHRPVLVTFVAQER